MTESSLDRSCRAKTPPEIVHIYTLCPRITENLTAPLRTPRTRANIGRPAAAPKHPAGCALPRLVTFDGRPWHIGSGSCLTIVVDITL